MHAPNELWMQLPDGQPLRDRRALWWIVGLLLLALASMIALVLYLRTFENEESLRQRSADSQWLQQVVRFHFQRLEVDARSAAQRRLTSAIPDGDNSGVLWHTPGVVLAHGWLPSGQDLGSGGLRDFMSTQMQLSRDNASNMRVLLDVTSGLRRIAYAGPMRDAQGQSNGVIWLAVPLSERGQHVGTYLLAVSMPSALQLIVPPWFMATHHLRLHDDHQPLDVPEHSSITHLDLPGAGLAIEVQALDQKMPMVPRLFLGSAVVFLLGMLISLGALSLDMRKRRAIERQLRAQMMLRTAMENAVAVGLRAWDAKGRILYVNRAFCTMVGLVPEDLIGRSAPFPYWPASQMRELQQVHEGLMREGTEGLGVEVQFQHSDGHLIDAQIHETALQNDRGEQIGWMSAVIDLSDRKQAERIARQQEERLENLGRLVAVGEMASTLAHELNQPLGALSGFSNGLLNRLRSATIDLASTETVVSRIARLADKAGQVIQRVNAFARQREMVHERISLGPFLQRLIKPLQKQGSLRYKVPNPWPDVPVWVDPGLLEHALRNVLANAHEWALGSPEPAVHVRLLQAPTEVGIAIGDSGPGVPAEQTDQIFQAFYSSRDGGMGMGLAICRSVIEAHHGRIEVSIDPLLGGACFTLWLPLRTSPTEEPA